MYLLADFFQLAELEEGQDAKEDEDEIDVLWKGKAERQSDQDAELQGSCRFAPADGPTLIRTPPSRQAQIEAEEEEKEVS